MSSIYILWDESHIWGLLVWRAIEAMQLPYRIVRGEEIAHGLLSGKPPALLLVPGGNARLKSDALGKAGLQAIRHYVQAGGSYLGFCGGAGLGLTSSDGLGLCPWGRAKFTDRMQHFVSGHIHASIGEPLDGARHLIPDTLGEAPLVPVWWPARFAPEEGTDVEVLASYTTPGDDFWIADLPLDTLPPGTFNDWEALYGIKLRPTFLEGQPCVLSGMYGKGRYVLSYTHLETPDSPQANRWLTHIIRELTREHGCPEGLSAATDIVPPWELEKAPVIWNDPLLVESRAIFDEIVTIGKNHCLFFQRNAWLIGWRAGIPGANLNNLYSAICSAVSTNPTADALSYWNTMGETFVSKLRLFHEGVTGYLLAERLAMTLSKTFPETVSRESLKNQRTALFGPPMASGGLYLELLEIIDRVMYLLLPRG